MSKGKKKSVNQKRENAMARRKGTKTRTTVDKIIHRKLRWSPPKTGSELMCTKN